MNGVVLWSCHAINLLHTSSGSISGLARCGNSITLPLPNLVAKLAILLRSVLCGHHSAIRSKAVLIVLQIHCSSRRIPLSFISVFLTFIVRTQNIYSHVWWRPMQSEHLPRVARCSLCAHRLSSIDFILFLCVCACVCIIVHVDFSLNLRWRSWRKRVWSGRTLFYYWQSSHTAPMNVIGVMTDLLATAVL